MLYTFVNYHYPAYTHKNKAGLLQSIPDDMRDFPEFYGNFISKRLDQLPIIFIADYETGIYSISIKLRGKCHIFSQKRRLCAICDSTDEITFHFSLTVNDIITGFDKKRHQNNRIMLSFCGDAKITSIEINSTELPVIWLAGDSTVTDQSSLSPYNPGLSYCGWGQMLPLFLSETYALCNLACSGLTTDTFKSQGFYSILYENLKPGDYVFLQFGHNDQKLTTLKSTERYYENLMTYVKEIKERNAIPILITPLARNSWNCSTKQYNDLLHDYAQAVIKVAKYANISYIDLHSASLDCFNTLGLECSKPFFYPGDYTHTNDYGGYLAAWLIQQEVMKHSNLSILKPLFNVNHTIPVFKPQQIKGWLFAPTPSSPNNSKTGFFTYLDALQYVQKAYKYFTINPLTDEPEAIVAAKQNGYYLKEFEILDSNIHWSSWVTLLTLACSGRYENVIQPELTFKHDEYAVWEHAIAYAQLLEKKTAGCIDIQTEIAFVVEGS